MRKIYTYTQKLLTVVGVLVLLLAGTMQEAKASHFVGGDIEYKCIGPRKWLIKLTMYRDCTGCATCYSAGNIGASLTPAMVAKPNTTLNPPGCTATPNSVTVPMQLKKVEDVGKELVAICGNVGKNGCTNLGTVTPGPYTPSIEKWIFEGELNLSMPTLNSSTCKFWDISYTSNARNSGMTNVPSEDFSIGATINIFDRSTTPCINNSPEIRNEPVAIVCSGQENILNMGAVDPDNDSLTYELGKAFKNYPNTIATYMAPFSSFYPFPLNSMKAPHINYPQPNGPYVVVDTIAGDVGFNAVYNGSSYMFGDMTMYIRQWTYDANGQPVLAGITMRDMQIYVVNCPANNPPRITTNPALQPGNRPKFDYTVCAGEQLCFTVIAKDTDVYPAIPRFDTTKISWNQAIVRPGKLTFGPTYTPGPGLPRPREDSWQFCWQTEEEDGRTLPYYFTVSAIDNFCPRVGRATRSFSITVSPTPKGTGVETDLKCGKRVYRVIKTDPKQDFTSATLEIANKPNDWSFTYGKRTKVAPLPNPPANGAPISAPRTLITDTFTYTIGGKYLVKYTLNGKGIAPGQFCTKIYYDTIVVDTNVVGFVKDTFVCKGTQITLTASAKWGTSPYTYRWFRNNTNGSPVHGPSNSAFNFTTTDTVTTKYYVRVVDLGGCQHTDSMTLDVKSLPKPLFAPDSMRLCFGDSFLLDAGNNGGNIASYKWSKGSTVLSDTSQTIVRSDSGNFTILMTDTFGCKQSSMLRLRVNSPVIVTAGIDTALCPKDTIKIGAKGGYKYQWDKIQGPGLANVVPKGYKDSISVTPLITTDYVVTAFVSYPDTAKSYLECSSKDTIRVTVRPVPNLSPVIPQSICMKHGGDMILPFRTITPANQTGGVGNWSFNKAPGAIKNVGISTVLYLDSLPSVPKDTFYPSMQTNLSGASQVYYFKYSYRGPASMGACLKEDSIMVRVLALPKVTAGTDKTLCINRATPFNMDEHDHYPPDISGKNGIWTVSLGGGLDSVVNMISTKYSFIPTKPGVLLHPQKNLLKYKYTINYTIPLGGGIVGCVNTDSVEFTVVPTPDIDAGKDFAVCKNEPVFKISDKAESKTTSTIPGSTFWSLAPNQTPNISEAIIGGQSFNAPSEKVPVVGGTWKLYYTDTSTGCKVYDSVNVEVLRLPVVDISYALAGQNDSVCKTSGFVQFKVSTTSNGGSGTYSGIGVSNTGLFSVQDPAVIPQNWYTAYYNYSISSKGTICTGYDSIQTFVQMYPSITVASVPPKCSYDTTDFNLSATASPSFYGVKWTHDGFGTFNNSDIPNPNYKFNTQDAARQFLNVTATTTNNGVCNPVSDSKRIDINPRPNPKFVCDSCVGCEPLNTQMYAVGAGVGGSRYDWYLVKNGNETPFAPSDSSISKIIPDYGVRTVKLRVTTPAGCVDESTGKVTVYAVPVASFRTDPEKTTIAKPFFSFVNTSTVPDGQSLKYIWDLGKDPSLPKDSPSRKSTLANPIDVEFGDTIADNIPVYLKVITEPGGCIDTAMRFIRIDPDITVFIPSVFRPTKGANTAPCADPTFNDCNDVFRVYADGFATIEVYVFDRWGQQVFATNNPDIGWNGLIENVGAECPQDVYIYQINATSYNGKKYTYSGSITLLR